MFRSCCFLLAVFLCRQTGFATSTLPFVDHLPYATGNLGSVGSVGNWAGSSSAITVVSNNLDGTGVGLPAASGNMAAMTSSTGSTYNEFASASGDITTGKVYCSFLLKVTDAASVSTTGERASSMNLQNGSSTRYAELYFKNVGGAVQLGLVKNGGTETYITSGAGSSVADGNVYLVVMSHEFVTPGTSNDVVKLWVNPASRGGAEDGSPNITVNTGPDITSATGMGRLYFTGGVASSIDELRLGTNWADVASGVGVPPASTPVPVITYAQLLPQGVVLRGTNGPGNGVYQVLGTTNLQLPLTNWPWLAAHNFDTNGNFDSTNLVAPGLPQQFFRLLVGGTIPPANTAPSITNQPQSLTAGTGQTASFMVAATGTATLSYFWLFNTNTPVGGNSSALTLLNVSTNNAGAYFVIVSNSVGSVTSVVASLTVNAPTAPSITTEPTNQIVTAGQNASFAVVANGSMPLSYQWYFNTNTVLANATNATLTLSNAQATNAGGYSVRVTNSVGSVTSVVATLTVNAAAPFITTQPQSQTVTVSNNATFTVLAGGTAPLSYQWYFNTNTVLTGATGASLTITNAQTNNAGGYTVVVSNSVTSITSAVATLTVVSAPVGGGDIYVATDGLTGNPGTLAQPTTLTKAITLVQPGGTIYLRGGTYIYSAQITLERTNTGAGELLRKRIFAYPAEQPVLDFSTQPYGDTSSVSNPRGLQINGHWWHLRGLEVKGSADNGIYVAGNSNIVERCITHHNRDTGLQIGRYASTVAHPDWPAYNLILNCDSYDNYDSPPNGGENADGFACKLTSGPGNVFRGCVAHHNVDDGWDLFAKTETGPIDPVTIDECVAYANGVLTDGTINANGDRNGFKLGGSSIAVNHIVTRSIAFSNLHNGFTWNSNPGEIRMVNNLAFDNVLGNYKFDVEGPIFINNMSFWKSLASDQSDRHGVSGSPATPSNCWWDKSKAQPSINSQGLIVTAADFVSLVPPAAGFARNTDGSINLGNFGKPAASSPLINAGDVPVLPNPGELPFDPATYYLGDPDIGAVESGP